MKTPKPILAYHNDPDLKLAYVAEAYAHRDADEYVQGDSARCAVGCTLGGRYDHSLYPDQLGVPEVIARLEDSIFEALAPGEAKHWPVRFLEAIPVGADLSMVWPRFALWLLTDGVPSDLPAGVRKVVGDVAELYRRHIACDPPSDQEWNLAAMAAWAARASSMAAAAAVARAASAGALAAAAEEAEAEAEAASSAGALAGALAAAEAASSAAASAAAARAVAAQAVVRSEVAQANQLIELLEACA